MLHAEYTKYNLQFKQPSGTSRGILHQKETWFIRIADDQKPEKKGYGECGMFRGLSADDQPGFEDQLAKTCRDINHIHLIDLDEWPSIRSGVEMALKSFHARNPFILFPTPFTEGTTKIPINGLIWMGDLKFMNAQIEEKLQQGFTCLKLKIGAIDWEAEWQLLKNIRNRYSPETLEIRVDANGAFSVAQAPEKLEALARLSVHSIEQPIRAGQPEQMARLCRQTPLPIALDEELIGVNDCHKQHELLDTIQPQYIILKPSLNGGFSMSERWIQIAEQNHIGWWITSALESNIGLNAIAQWTALMNSELPQGLGTGKLFTNNFSSPLEIRSGFLRSNPNTSWNISNLQF